MARDQSISEAFYAATEQIVDRGLRRDDSLFAPGRPIWTAEVAAEVAAAIAPEDISPGSFEQKLLKQLEGVSPDGVQFAAEILYIALLAEHDTGAPRKRDLVQQVLALMPSPPPIPLDLDTGLASGIATYGQGGRNMRDASLRCLAGFVAAWKQVENSERLRLLGDAWLFRDFARSLEMRRGDMQREALLYIAFPDSFEPIVSTDAKSKIATAFSSFGEDASAPLDERLLSIRRAMEEEYGPGFSFYGDGLPDIWRTPSVSKGHAWLLRGATDQSAGRRVNRIADWLERGYASIGWEDSLGVRPGMSVPELVLAIREASPDLKEPNVRMGAGNMERFFDRMAAGDLVATVDGDDVYLGRIAGDPVMRGTGEAGAVWQRDVSWLNPTEPFSRLDLAADLQTALKTRMTLTDLSKHRAVLDALLGETEKSNGGDAMALIPPVAEALAEALFVTRAWLAEIVELLNEKRQVVFYGPPGTGKTFVAQALARHVEETGGESELVQFHPAYSYEDFFEGYRPKLDGANGVEYELRAGPLLRIADAARANPERPYLLIIDEINRGNIAKIFGELYFLLEYRERGIKLQYSPEVNFSLPENLYVIGTMNTADRSIALVDSALRRRFYFFPFLPNVEPLRGVLRRWLSHQGYDLEAADYLEVLNAVLEQSGGDDEFAVGASYFITRNGAPDVERVWRYAIAPLLEERFYGARKPAEIQRAYSPEAIHQPPAEPES
jgi:5-methylcytosine-specific restriction enzyme B